ncbi:molybdopterin biosynthesis-like protein MoeZ [bacterium BMS3Abin01]|nr:molybdopterin biosynthesis-like protein MoeZ [bacterium BMS3Abin01]
MTLAGSYRTLKTLILSVLLLLSLFLLASCGSDQSTTTSTQAEDTPLTRRAQEVFATTRGSDSEFPGNMITAAQLAAILQDPQRSQTISLLDTRPATELETQGAIPGSLWIKMQSIADPESLAKLPRDRTIVCISPTGHTANQVCTTLRWLGYDAILLKYGMGSWTQTPAGKDITAADAQRAIDFPYPVIEAGGVPAGNSVVKATATFTAPPENEYDELQQVAQEYMSDNVLDQEYPFNNISATNLYDRLSDPVLREETWLLDIRSPAAYDSLGHIEGTINIPWRRLGEPENLGQLPENKLIVVIGDNGRDSGQVTGILKMLGYSAVTLRTGMAGWLPTPETQEILDAVAAAHYPVATN